MKIGTSVFICMMLWVGYVHAGVYCNQGEILDTECGNINMYGCCQGSAVIFCEPATGNLCKWDCQNNILQPGGSCYGKCGGYNQYPGGGFMCGCDPNCVALGDCCDDICDDCADIIPECVDASGSTVCGWQSTKGWYDCMTVAVPGPPEHPMQCEAVGSSCTPSCAGKYCGPDGCGGSCGSCAWSQECSPAGQCIATCEPNCAGKNCGPDGCGVTCGDCPFGTFCNAHGVCENTCTPNCYQTGSECGPDGCGGTCGYCGIDVSCVDGACVKAEDPDPPAVPPDTSNSFIPSNTPSSDASGGGFWVNPCPPGQVEMYGDCATPVDYDDGDEPEGGGGCSLWKGELYGSGSDGSFITIYLLICLGLLYIFRRKS